MESLDEANPDSPSGHEPSTTSGNQTGKLVKALPGLIPGEAGSFRGFPDKIWQMILDNMNGATLKVARQTCTKLMVMANPILRRSLVVDITPKMATYSRLMYLSDYHYDYNIDHTVNAVTFVTYEYNETELAPQEIQRRIIVTMLEFIVRLENLVHIGIYGQYLSPFQLWLLTRESPRIPWPVRSIFVSGSVVKILPNCYSWWPCLAFSTDRDLFSEAVSMASRETCGELQRLALVASYHAIAFPTVAPGENAQPRKHWPCPPALNYLTLTVLAKRFVNLKWLIIRFVPLPTFYKLAEYDAQLSYKVRSEFMTHLHHLKCLKRLSIQVHGYIGFREAHGKNADEGQELLDDTTCQWYKALALEIMENGPTIVDMVVRASWPDYFVVERGADGTFDVRQKQIEITDRYKFPIGLLC